MKGYELERVKSGIPGLDDIMEGGFPKGAKILVAGMTGSGKTIFAAQFLHNGATLYGENGVFVTCEEDASDFKKNMRRFGIEFDSLEKQGKVRILDAQSLRGQSLDLNLQAILSKMEEINGSRLVIDSLTVLLAFHEDKLSYRSTMELLYDQLRARGYTTLMTLSIPTGSSLLGFGMEEFIADGLLQLENKVDGLELKTQLVIRKMRGTNHSRKFHRVVFLPTGLEIIALSPQ